MKRAPLYSPEATATLDDLEAGSDEELSDAVCDAIDLICDHGDSAEARREQLRTAGDAAWWKIAVRSRHDDWVVLWWPKGRDALIVYIGLL